MTYELVGDNKKLCMENSSLLGYGKKNHWIEIYFRKDGHIDGHIACSWYLKEFGVVYIYFESWF